MHAFSRLIKFISAVMAMSYCTLYRISAQLHVGSASAERWNKRRWVGSLAMCYSQGGCPGVHECSVHPLICEALITLAAAVSKSFVACCLVKDGSDFLFEMSEASGQECQSLWCINWLYNRWFQGHLTLADMPLSLLCIS